LRIDVVARIICTDVQQNNLSWLGTQKSINIGCNLLIGPAWMTFVPWIKIWQVLPF